ncbi:MAG: polyphenol oxidase family protein [Gaiellaceae bacterium]|jgi:YfiH family protein
MAREIFCWQAPGPYRVAFSTRLGGVSEGPFASLNLGKGTGDELKRVLENRKRLCAELEIDPARSTMARQQHGAVAQRAEAKDLLSQKPGFPECDALWSEEPGQGMLLVTADCLPLAIARVDRERPALALVHAGWRGMLAGVLESALRGLGRGRTAAVLGPAIGPCCFEVSEDVAASFRRRFGREVVNGRKVDLWLAAENALEDAGCESVERVDICTSCHPELFFSYRRDMGHTGRQGVIGAIA